MKKILTLTPIHSFLILPYLALFLYSQNAHLLTVEMLIRPLVFSVLVSVLAFCISYYVFDKNSLKAGIFVTLFLFLLSFYGFFYDYIEYLYYLNIWPFSNIHRYLIIFYFVFCVIIYFFVKYSKYNFYNLTRWLNILLIFLIIFNILHSITSILKNKYNTNKSICKEINIKLPGNKKPDIFYIIIDGFANQNILKKYYNINIDTFVKFLEKKGFFVSTSSIANYYSTPQALHSTLNMKYIEGSESVNVNNNLVFNIFKSNGYKIYVVKSGYTISNNFVCTDEYLYNDILNDYERGILKNTIFRLDDLVGIVPYIRIKKQFEIIKNFNFKLSSPKFLFAHIVCPHPPFVFNRNGELKPVNSFSDNVWDPKNAYGEQTLFVVKEIMAIVNNILEKYKFAITKPIIIIQSDHGPFYSGGNRNDFVKCRTYIFNAIYLENKKWLYNNISAVNTFRYVLKYEFNFNIDLLQDKPAGLNDLLQSRIYNDL
ncbi:MAG: hypothetical protein N3A01_06695 [Bacteroidales bacterium]|nr:hypothetical protein [Bacteroidales bacterium]